MSQKFDFIHKISSLVDRQVCDLKMAAFKTGKQQSIQSAIKIWLVCHICTYTFELMPIPVLNST